MLFYLVVSFIAILGILFSLYSYELYGRIQIRKTLYSDSFIFIKKSPKEIKYIQGNKKEIENIYPFSKEKEWSPSEQNALFLGKKQTLLTKYDEKLYSIELQRMKLFNEYVLFVTIKLYTNSLESKSQEDILNGMDCDFMVMDSDSNIVYKNKYAKNNVSFTNLYEVCSNKEVLSAILENEVETRQIMELKIDDEVKYFDISFFPKVQYDRIKYYWCLLCYDITELYVLKNQVKSKAKILDIIQNGVYELFTTSLLEKSINTILYELGSNLGMQSAYICKYYNDSFIVEHEWRDIDVEMEHQLYTRIDKNIYLKFIDNKTEPIIINKDDVSEERQKVWDKYGIGYKIITPLFYKDGSLWGFIGFDCYEYNKFSLNEERLKLIRLVAVTLNAIIILQDDDKQIKKLNSQLVTIIQSLSTQIQSEIQQTQLINERLKQGY